MTVKKDLIEILEYQPVYQPYFERLNRNWIEKYFRMEPVDEFVLAQPEKAILENGGAILMAAYNNNIAGTAALKKIDHATYEFTKLGVDENYRGKGLGEALTLAAIEKARSAGAMHITLYSNTSLQPAIHLYRKLGFKEAPVEPGRYARCNIKMELWLGPVIIQADLSDAAVIASIGRESFSDAFGSVFNKRQDLEQYLDHTYNIGKIATSIARPNNVFFIALHNDRPVGFVKIKKQSLNSRIAGDKHTELQKIYVLKEYHGRGISAPLMQSVLQLTKEIQPDYLWLDVIIQNARAIRFYEKNGFDKKGFRSFIIGSQQFEYHVMALKTLRPCTCC